MAVNLQEYFTELLAAILGRQESPSDPSGDILD